MLMKIPFSPPDIRSEEMEEVVAALRSGWITTGERTKKFEQKIGDYIGNPRAVCLNSATAAMEMTLRLLGVGPGDEVITTAYTYTATASVIHHVGAKIVLVDTIKGSWEMDLEKLEQAISPQTKVIMPVDLGGRLCDYEGIYSIVEEQKKKFSPRSKLQEIFNRIIVLADSAHGFGATRMGQVSGSLADFTAFSFHAVKNLTTGEGGAVTWKSLGRDQDEQLYRDYMTISLHGQSKDALAKTKVGGWEYDILYPAYKCNMTDIQAAIGLKQLERYDQILKRRKEIVSKYDEAFLPLGVKSIEHYTEQEQSAGHLYLFCVPGISLEQRNEIIVELGEKGIATNVHYKPLPLLTAYKNLGFDIKNYPCAYDQYARTISLPLHTKLTEEEVDYIIFYVKECLKKRS